MMKHTAKACALAWLLALLLCAQAFAAQDEDPVAFTFNGREVRRSELMMTAEGCAQGQLISSPTAYEEAIDSMVVNHLAPEAKAAELGLDQFTDEELAKIRAEADTYYEAQLDAYVESLMPNATEEEKADFRQALRDYWDETGTTLERAEETHLFNYIRERLLETMDVEVTDAEIEQVFAEQVEKDRAYFENNVRAYEYYTEYRNSDIWFVPEGYRGVLHILLRADEALTDAYNAAQSAGEDLEAARAAILDSKKETVDAIYARLEAGESFVDLIGEYGEDPGMTDQRLENGYAVHPESSIWAQEFTDGAFSEAMKAPGEHILYYLRDIPAGAVEMDERIRESIVDYLGGQKRDAILKEWAAEYPLEINQAVIDQMKLDAEAQDAAAQDAE